MQKVSFVAQEYQKSAIFERHEYNFRGSVSVGWRIERDGQLWLNLPDGYKLVRTRYCGVCSTDLSRHFLPFELPQVTGHEVVGFEVEPGEESRPLDYFELKLANGTSHSFSLFLREYDFFRKALAVAVEINASCRARGIPTASSNCLYCYPKAIEGLDRQCPKRITLGIDRLPGGFSPFLLAPRDSLVPVPSGVSLSIAALWEPFAAALHGVETTPNISNSSVAVLGPRKLGLMVVAALAMYKKKLSLTQDVSSMKIIAVARHKNLLNMCQRLGAESLVDTSVPTSIPKPGSFDIVFDTTGSASGFALALQLAKKTIHLKSTSGAKIYGMEQLTPMVIDEISLLPFSHSNLSFTWPKEDPRHNVNIYVGQGVDLKSLTKDLTKSSLLKFHQISIDDAFEVISSDSKLVALGSPLPRFDLAIVSNVQEADRVIRPKPDSPFSLVRARGAILFAAHPKDLSGNELVDAITNRGLEIRTSRCGDARESLKFLSEHSHLAADMEKILFTYRMGLSEINKAFDLAKKSDACLKILVDTSSPS